MTIDLTRRTFLAASSLAIVAASDPPAEGKVIAVTGGRITGRKSEVPGVVAWLGIPYAAPPLGALRWKPPQPVLAWDGIRRADRFSASPCAMPQSFDAPGMRKVEMSEDCLTLNIWAPAKPSLKPRPVMVWIYGGAFAAGTTDDPLYEGAQMAAGDVVFVSINYRVGILGFFAHPELAAESTRGVSGNYALLDQIAALRWVKDNIAAFGGDPGNVTILGQSAGSFSVAFHLVMPESRGLFQRGICQSGASMGQLNSLVLLTDGKEMEQAGLAFAKRVGAADLAALRAIDPMELVKADDQTWIFHPALDGAVIPAHPFDLIASGRHADVPIIAGFNADEGMVFHPLGGGTPEGLSDALAPYFGDKVAEARRVYASSTNEEAVTRGRQVFGDLIFNWNTAALAVAMAKYGTQPVHFYHYAYTGVPFPGSPGNMAQLHGAFHGAEIGLVLRNPGARGGTVDAKQRQMTEMLSGYWLAFARDGNPNGAGRPRWPAYVHGKPTVFHIDGDANKPGPIPFHDRLALIGQAWNNPILDGG